MKFIIGGRGQVPLSMIIAIICKYSKYYIEDGPGWFSCPEGVDAFLSW